MRHLVCGPSGPGVQHVPVLGGTHQRTETVHDGGTPVACGGCSRRPPAVRRGTDCWVGVEHFSGPFGFRVEAGAGQDDGGADQHGDGHADPRCRHAGPGAGAPVQGPQPVQDVRPHAVQPTGGRVTVFGLGKFFLGPPAGLLAARQDRWFSGHPARTRTAAHHMAAADCGQVLPGRPARRGPGRRRDPRPIPATGAGRYPGRPGAS